MDFKRQQNTLYSIPNNCQKKTGYVEETGRFPHIL